MEQDGLDTGSLPATAPARRRGRYRAGAIIVVAAALVGLGLSRTGGDGASTRLRTGGAPEAAPTPGSTEPAATDTTATTAAAPTTNSSAAAPVTATTRAARPTATTGRATTTTITAAPKAATGTVLAIDRPGIWVVDLATGTLRRVADGGPFDVAGDSVLTARGRQVFATPLAGGDTVLRYEASSQGSPQFSSGYTFDPSSESVDWIEAGADGSAVVGVFGSVVAPDGTPSGRNGNYFLLSPTGDRVSTPYLRDTFAWSADGTKLAATSFVTANPSGPPTMTTPTTYTPPKDTLIVLGPDGRTLQGPVEGPQVQGIHNLQWAGDGRSLVFTPSNSAGFSRFDLGSGRFDVIPGQPASIDIGPDGRIVASRYSDHNDTTVYLIDAASGTTTPFAPRGTDPRWSPDGLAVVVAAVPPPNYAQTPYPLVVLDSGGIPRFTVTVPDQLTFGKKGPVHGGHPGPQWSTSGRYLVVDVHSR